MPLFLSNQKYDSNKRNRNGILQQSCSYLHRINNPINVRRFICKKCGETINVASIFAISAINNLSNSVKQEK